MKSVPLSEVKSGIETAIQGLSRLQESAGYDQRRRALSYLQMALEEVNSLSQVTEGTSKRLLLEDYAAPAWRK